ncbi:hypothetical protein MelnitzEXVC044M_148 [Methylophilales phage Melnitz EXVC044M]|nr:hypothetical protein Melnitz1EXVC043M_147 [Methylophilales phage Melnitz-1 EXVC043M]QZI94653.1 hypothetical protein Melnitz2EXVC040M_148 [Methylophilales phage Melnitz-2 EXVC040M]QZI94875.1 hypothetical protein MelnitzEXVC044M_148 [Methylophilales phage Melnitz EXVC044M]QZI95096.1 hypothetical protein Melnitz3EXVC039M_148 [Methylophilales phage Melnitz-3 EXVC039M]
MQVDKHPYHSYNHYSIHSPFLNLYIHAIITSK